MKTVVHVLPYMAKGGTEKHVLTLCRGQKDRYRIVLLAPEGEILPEFLDLHIEHVPFPVLSGNFFRKIEIFKEKLLEIHQRYGVDIVHVHAAHEFLRFSRRVLPRTPIIFHLSAHQGSRLSKWFNYWLSARLSRRHADLLIAVSEEEKRLVTAKGFPAERVRVVYNGHEQDEGDDIERIEKMRRDYGLDGHLVIGNLGRLHRTKRLDILIEAFRLLMGGSEERLKLLIIGDGPERAALEKQAVRAGLKSSVHFPGFVARGDRVLRVFDLFVLPTTFEGCSNVLVEAMAKGLPIVTTDIPSVSWMFKNGKNGLLFQENNIKALYTALKRLISDRELRISLGRAAEKRFADAFKAEKMIQRVDEIYRNLFI